VKGIVRSAVREIVLCNASTQQRYDRIDDMGERCRFQPANLGSQQGVAGGKKLAGP